MAAHGRRELLAAAASGLLLGAAFLPRVPGVLAWVALVPLLLALERRVEAGRPAAWFRLGYVAGCVYFLVGTHWIALLDEHALTIGWLKYLGWLLASLYLALYWGIAAAGAGWLARRSGVAARWTLAPVLVIVEQWRAWGELGFPWFQPGYSQHEIVSVLQLASLGGVMLVTLWLLLVNGCVVELLRARSRRAAVLLLLVVIVPLAWGRGQLRSRAEPAGVPIALVQGNIPAGIKWAGTHTEAILRTFVSLSDSAGRTSHPRLVLWPETATGTYLRRSPSQSAEVARLAARIDAPVFMGYAHYTWGADGKPLGWNAAGGWQPDGSLTPFYAKRHLVPFGERIPFQRMFPALGKLELGQAEWEAGAGSVLFSCPSLAGDEGDAPLMSVLVCFESIFPDLARSDVRAGSKLLINITNDEWFGNGAALVQHAAMAPFRAVENHVPLARCANTGLTAMIDAYGVVTAKLPVFTPGVLVAPLPAAGATTLYTRIGDWPAVAAGLFVLALAVRPRQTVASR